MKLLLGDAHLHLKAADSLPSISSNNCIFLINGTTPLDWKQILSLHSKQIIPFLGLHPWYLDKYSLEDLSILEDYLKHNSQIGIGEIGLDNSQRFKENPNNITKQIDCFQAQLEIAFKYKRPVSIHIVKAWDAFFTILKNKKLPTFMIHAFSHSK